MKNSLQIQHEILLLQLQAQRLVFMQHTPEAPLLLAIKPRSATMRFILRRPGLCLWILGESLPFVMRALRARQRKR